jgi:single-strand DNA-binding protein
MFVPKNNSASSLVLKAKKKQKTEWHNISVFGKLAEIVSSYCYKGSKVYVEGKLQTDQYEKNGETRYSTKIVVDEFIDFNSGSQPKFPTIITLLTPAIPFSYFFK